MRKTRADPLRASLDQMLQAEALLLANQASFVAAQDRNTLEQAQFRKHIDERFRHFEERLQHFETILRHLVEVLPEALRNPIGYSKEP